MLQDTISGRPFPAKGVPRIWHPSDPTWLSRPDPSTQDERPDLADDPPVCPLPDAGERELWEARLAGHPGILTPAQERAIGWREVRVTAPGWRSLDGPPDNDGYGQQVQKRGRLLAEASAESARQEFRRKAGQLLRDGHSIEAIAEQVVTGWNANRGIGRLLRAGWGPPLASGHYQIIDPDVVAQQRGDAEWRVLVTEWRLLDINQDALASWLGRAGKGRLLLGRAQNTTSAEKHKRALLILRQVAIEMPSRMVVRRLTEMAA